MFITLEKLFETCLQWHASSYSKEDTMYVKSSPLSKYIKYRSRSFSGGSNQAQLIRWGCWKPGFAIYICIYIYIDIYIYILYIIYIYYIYILYIYIYYIYIYVYIYISHLAILMQTWCLEPCHSVAFPINAQPEEAPHPGRSQQTTPASWQRIIRWNSWGNTPWCCAAMRCLCSSAAPDDPGVSWRAESSQSLGCWCFWSWNSWVIFGSEIGDPQGWWSVISWCLMFDPQGREDVKMFFDSLVG